MGITFVEGVGVLGSELECNEAGRGRWLIVVHLYLGSGDEKRLSNQGSHVTSWKTTVALLLYWYNHKCKYNSLGVQVTSICFIVKERSLRFPYSQKQTWHVYRDVLECRSPAFGALPIVSTKIISCTCSYLRYTHVSTLQVAWRALRQVQDLTPCGPHWFAQRNLTRSWILPKKGRKFARRHLEGHSKFF